MANDSFAGSITTLDGKRIEGIVAIDSKSALMITPKGKSPQKIELANLLHAEMDATVENSGMARGVVLTDGTALAAATFRHADADTIKLVPPTLGAEVSIKAVRVARIIFGNTSDEALASVPRGASGVLLESGDFVEGEFVGLDNGKVKISSVLFGIQSFDAGRPATAVILRDAKPASGEFVVRLADGSVLPAGAIGFDKTATQIQKTPFGTVSVQFDQIAEISAGGGRIVPLTTLTPANSSKTAKDDAVGVRLVGLDQPPVNNVHVPANAAIIYDLNGSYESFIAHVGVPAHLVPTQRVRIIVLVDGKERFRSDERTSVDDALPVAVNVRGARQITLQVESAGSKAAPNGVATVWADPILVKSGT